jgi:hypothetical protein
LCSKLHCIKVFGLSRGRACGGDLRSTGSMPGTPPWSRVEGTGFDQLVKTGDPRVEEPVVREVPVHHPGVELRANLKSIPHRCHLFGVAFVWELTKETIHLPLGCLQGGLYPARVPGPPPHSTPEPRTRNRGTPLITNNLPPLDHHRALGTVLL